jgi:hypothetical protein
MARLGAQKQNANKDPATVVAELRDTINRAVDKARQDGVRDYQIADVFEAAARNARMRLAAMAPVECAMRPRGASDGVL